MDKSIVHITKNAPETAKVGENLAHHLDGHIYCLYGDLGSGKTTFTQGFAKGLGITTRLLSPTFIIVRRYDLPKNIFFYHIDLYRLNSTGQMKGIGLEEIFTGPEAIVVIEWAERLGDLLPKRRTDIQFEVRDDGTHTITITKSN
jgi:tRNA threonylcarbamoyladenosine biosynthesis protein TsaE